MADVETSRVDLGDGFRVRVEHRDAAGTVLAYTDDVVPKAATRQANERTLEDRLDASIAEMKAARAAAQQARDDAAAALNLPVTTVGEARAAIRETLRIVRAMAVADADVARAALALARSARGDLATPAD